MSLEGEEKNKSLVVIEKIAVIEFISSKNFAYCKIIIRVI